MNRVVIVDDETIMRVTLRSLVNWEALGYRVEADFVGGVQALLYLKEHPADLLVTDMKMPDMSGLELMEELKRCNRLPVTLVLSGYNEFELVREAFRLGAYDYLLKADLNEKSLGKLLQVMQEKIFREEGRTGGEQEPPAGRTEEALEPGEYAVVLFEVDDFLKQAARFGGDLTERLEKPMLELARQIPRVASRAVLQPLYPSRLALYYKVREPMHYRDTLLSIVRQLQSVWRDFMNLTVSAAVCPAGDENSVQRSIDRCSELLKLCVLKGRGAVSVQWEREALWERVKACKERYGRLVSALCCGDTPGAEWEKEAFFTDLHGMDPEQARETALAVVVLLADQFREYEDDFFTLFPEEVDYEEKLSRLQDSRELELWMSNYFRWVQDYAENRYDSRQADLILRARRFMADNYANPELTLGLVADYVGLNEKYFSSRFTREAGCTFSSYLTDIRMQRARELMGKTDLKIYEVSERVGYHNVEHFNRMFKRTFGTAPGDYRKEQKGEQKI